jgi:hypothetical protein
MSGLLQFLRDFEGARHPTWGMAITPFASMQQCPADGTRGARRIPGRRPVRQLPGVAAGVIGELGAHADAQQPVRTG